MLRNVVVTCLTILLLIFSFLAGTSAARVDYAKTTMQSERAVDEMNAAAMMLIVFAGIWVLAFFGWPQ